MKSPVSGEEVMRDEAGLGTMHKIFLKIYKNIHVF
jgi:hypothetical protein